MNPHDPFPPNFCSDWVNLPDESVFQSRSNAMNTGGASSPLSFGGDSGSAYPGHELGSTSSSVPFFQESSPWNSGGEDSYVSLSRDHSCNGLPYQPSGFPNSAIESQSYSQHASRNNQTQQWLQLPQNTRTQSPMWGVNSSQPNQGSYTNANHMSNMNPSFNSGGPNYLNHLNHATGAAVDPTLSNQESTSNPHIWLLHAAGGLWRSANTMRPGDFQIRCLQNLFGFHHKQWLSIFEDLYPQDASQFGLQPSPTFGLSYVDLLLDLWRYANQRRNAPSDEQIRCASIIFGIEYQEAAQRLGMSNNDETLRQRQLSARPEHGRDLRYCLKKLLHSPSIPASKDHGKPFVCTTCYETFGTKARWKAHEERNYPSQVYLCTFPNCPSAYKRFARKTTLEGHYSHRHGGQISAIPINVTYVGPNDACVFKNCQAQFNNPRQRMEHLGDEFERRQWTNVDWRAFTGKPHQAWDLGPGVVHHDSDDSSSSDDEDGPSHRNHAARSGGRNTAQKQHKTGSSRQAGNKAVKVTPSTPDHTTYQTQCGQAIDTQQILVYQRAEANSSTSVQQRDDEDSSANGSTYALTPTSLCEKQGIKTEEVERIKDFGQMASLAVRSSTAMYAEHPIRGENRSRQKQSAQELDAVGTKSCACEHSRQKPTRRVTFAETGGAGERNAGSGGSMYRRRFSGQSTTDSMATSHCDTDSVGSDFVKNRNSSRSSSISLLTQSIESLKICGHTNEFVGEPESDLNAFKALHNTENRAEPSICMERQ